MKHFHETEARLIEGKSDGYQEGKVILRDKWRTLTKEPTNDE